MESESHLAFLLATTTRNAAGVENESWDEELFMSDTNIACWET